jgi:Ni/Co efflux regulator RcnB
LAFSVKAALFLGSFLMKRLGMAAAVALLLASSGTAFAAESSGRVVSTTQTVLTTPNGNMPSTSGRWSGGDQAPGGWSAYRPLVRGAVLPEYWMQPQFYIDDFERYGFATPQDDYGWSRYYDDAVLTDSSGRVADIVKGVDWKRFDNGQFATPMVSPGADFGGAGATVVDTVRMDEGRRRPDARELDREVRRDFDRGRGRGRIGKTIGSVGGALIGGAVGAVAGGLIAGKGERLAGSLIGGGVGALAGLAISHGSRGGKHRHDRYDAWRGSHWGRSGSGYGGYETITTTSYVMVAPITTTTTTTKTTYETVTTGSSTYHPKRPLKRRPHRCTCHR